MKNILDYNDRAKAENLKGGFMAAAKPLLNAIKANVQRLPRSEHLKEVLQAELVLNYGPKTKSNVLLGMSQRAGLKKISDLTRFVGNPYWYEFGTSGGIKPTPYFRPAVSAAKQAVASALATEMKKALLP